MNPIRIEHEKELLRRLVISHWDFHQAKQFAGYILTNNLYGLHAEEFVVIHKAFNTALVISYARPFTHSDQGKSGKVCNLPEKFEKVFNAKESKLHQQVTGRNGLRNAVYAHSDSAPRQLNIRVADVHGVPIAIPISRDSFVPLEKAKVEMLRDMIDKLLGKIADEQIRIQSLLPTGTRF